MQMIKVFNPAKPSQLAWSGPETPAGDVGAIARKAKAAQTAWARLPARARHGAMVAFLDAIEHEAADLAERMVLEQGKLRAEAKGEVAKSLVEARWMLGRVLEEEGSIMASPRAGVRAMRLRRPRGVILAITPWNFPVLTPMRKIVPGLVFGNAVLLKPSSDAPGAAEILQRIGEQTLPEGLLSVIYGGASVANAAIHAADVDAVTFTGSTDVGRKIMAAAANGLKEVSLELGGKNPVILHDPADLDAALDHVVQAAFANAGQRCTAISRVIARSDLRNAVIEGLSRRIGALKPGPGMDSEATLAPLSTHSQFEKVQSFMAALDPSEALVLAGGRPADLPDDGLFFQPTLVEVKRPDASINFEEIFGPVLGVEFYDTIEDAVARANSSPYGLTASVFASDLRAVRRFEDEIEAGMVHVNHGTFPDENMPFGGWKASGVGAPSVGPEAAQFYTRTKAVYESI